MFVSKYSLWSSGKSQTNVKLITKWVDLKKKNFNRLWIFFFFFNPKELAEFGKEFELPTGAYESFTFSYFSMPSWKSQLHSHMIERCIGTRFAGMSRPLYSGCEQDTGLRAHLKWIMDSALCDCKEAEQTVYHILQDCPIWRKQRHQLWPQDESTTNKLWGTAKDLWHTNQFLATCGLRV